MSSRLATATVWSWIAFLVIAIALIANSMLGGRGVAPTQEGLSAEELSAQPSSFSWEDSESELLDPVNAADARDVQIKIESELGYFDEQGRHTVDLYEQDYAYLTIQVEAVDGQPVLGAMPTVSIYGTSRQLQQQDRSSRLATNEYGLTEVVIVGGQMGLDRLEVKFANASAELAVNVISLSAAGFPSPPIVEGGIPWEELRKARIAYGESALTAEFPEFITERGGQTVKLSGFMMPLESELKQRRFLLTSLPPSCFFHVPGGPAGAVEVFAPDGVEVSWDPVVLEGRFEPQQSSDVGVVYRLHDATLVDH